MRHGSPALLVAGVLLTASSGAAAAGPNDHGLTPIPGSFLVTLEEGADRGPLKGLLRVFGAELRYEYELLPDRVNVRGVPPGVEVALSRVPGVRSITPDFEVTAHLAESVPLIGADSVAAQVGGGAGIRVCILDTGINPDHLMFSDDPTRIAAWKDFVDEHPDPYDDDDHGSNVAGIIGGTTGLVLNGDPFQGVAPEATLYVGKVLDASGSGMFSDLQAGIEWCAGLGPDPAAPRADVINMSLGAGAFSQVCDAVDPTGTASVVNAAAAAGVLVVSSAGNERNGNAVGTPACASGSMAIGATYDANMRRQIFLGCADQKPRRDQIACFSNHWDSLDVVAPGCVSQSADGSSTSTVVGMCGTSQAAPHVAGLAALVMQTCPELSAADVRQQINDTALDLGDPGFDPTYGNGRIQAGPAVACSDGGTCTITQDPELSCSDGVDNDCDGLIDGDDSDCNPDEPDPPPPACGLNKETCSADGDCCSNNCGRNGGCRGN